MGLHRLLFFVFRKHHRCGFTNSNAHTQSDGYANTNRDSHAKPDANPHCNAHADSWVWDRSH